MTRTRSIDLSPIHAGATATTSPSHHATRSRGDPDLVTCSVHVHWSTLNPPAVREDQLAQSGVIVLAIQEASPHRIHYRVSRGAVGAGGILHLALDDRTAHRVALCRYDAREASIALSCDDRSALALAFGWDQDQIEVSGTRCPGPSAAVAAILGAEALADITPELLAALEFVTLVRLFHKEVDNGLRLAWPDGPRKTFHTFVSRLLVAVTQGIGG
jgi:hypothetical protein